MVVADDRKPWERTRGEDDELEPMRWFSRFEGYRLMGPERSLLSAFNLWLVENGQKKRNNYPNSWSLAFKKWRWKERAEKWDLSEHAKLIAEDEAERQAMLKRHVQGARAWQVKALRWLESSKIEDGPLALKAWKEGITEERKARGLPEWILQLLTMDEDELRKRYRDLAGIGGDRDDTDDAGGGAAPEERAAPERGAGPP